MGILYQTFKKSLFNSWEGFAIIEEKFKPEFIKKKVAMDVKNGLRNIQCLFRIQEGLYHFRMEKKPQTSLKIHVINNQNL